MMAGNVFAGTARFDLVRTLGEGGMGLVYEAFDRDRGGLCALKLLPSVTPAALVRFKREYRALQGLHHRNLITLGELLSDREHWFFTMELIDGVDFLSWVGAERTDPAPAPATRTWVEDAPPSTSAARGAACDVARLTLALAQLVAGLRFLHDNGKVHRDVKPSNILVTPAGRVVLLDFGLVADSAERDGARAGTPGYMAPEYVLRGEVAPAADLYAVGVVLFRALTGVAPPVDGALRGALLAGEAGPRPSAVVPDVPAALDDLCAELLAPDPRARPSARDVLARLGSAETAARAEIATTFVGRAAELAALERAYTDSRHAPVTAVVDGPSGIGKSALLDELVARLGAAPAPPLVLRGRCYESEGIPYKAIDGVVDALADTLVTAPADLLAHQPADAALLGVLFPALGRVPGLAPAQGASLDTTQAFQARRDAERAGRALLAAVATWRPIVIVIDDVQWSDRDSLDFLRAVSRPPGAPPHLLVLASRHPELALGDAARRVTLSPLSDAEARALAGELLRGGDPRSAAEIAAEAGGNPFFIAELALRAAASRVPTLDELVQERVERVDAEARRILELAAVAAAPLHQRVIAEAAALPASDFARLVDDLRADRLVRTGGLTLDDVVETHHDRIREAVVAHLPPGTRRAHHLRLARALEIHASEDHEALAAHFEGGGELVHAGHHAVRAGDQAARALAFESAAQLYRRALAWLPADAPDAEHLRERLADALANAGLGADAAAEYRRAAQHAGPEHALELRRRAAEHLLRSGRVDDGIAALRDLLARVRVRMPRRPTEALASLLLRRAHVRIRGLAATERAEHTLAPADLFRADTLWVAAARLGPIDPIAAADFQVRHLLDCLALGEPFRVARALLAEAVFAAIDGPRARRRVDALMARARPIVERIQHPYTAALLCFTEGLIAFQVGDFTSARDGLSRAADRFRRDCPGANHDRAVSERFALDSLVYLGELHELERRLPQLLEDAERRGDLYQAAELCTGLPNVTWLTRDRPDEARRRNQRGIEPWPRGRFYLQHYYHLLAGVNIALYEGDGAGAFDTMEVGWRGMRTSLLLRIQAVRTEALFLRARAGLAAGGAHARAIAKQCAQQLARERVPWAPGLADAIEAGLAMRAGKCDQALALLGRAEQTLAAAGAALVAAACRAHARRLDGGDEAEASGWLARCGVARPERFVGMLLPA